MLWETCVSHDVFCAQLIAEMGLWIIAHTTVRPPDIDCFTHIIIWMPPHPSLPGWNGGSQKALAFCWSYRLWKAILVFSCDQAALWMVQSVPLSVCPSVCQSVCHTLLTMFPPSHHHEIFKGDYPWQKWCPCKMSKVKVTEVKTPLPDCNCSLNSSIAMKWYTKLEVG